MIRCSISVWLRGFRFIVMVILLLYVNSLKVLIMMLVGIIWVICWYVKVIMMK